MRTIWILFLTIVSAGCGRNEKAQSDDAERTYAVTRWSAKTELFMEYPALVVGQKHRFAVHFTDLRSFKPLTEGRVTVELRPSTGTREAFTAPAPSRPGIFGVDVTPAQAGRYSMSVRLSAPGLEDQHEIGEVEIYASEAGAQQRAPAQEEPEGTKFLKEQQWNLDFSTEVVRERQLRDSLTVPAEVRPRSSGESELTAPTAGRLTAATSFTVGLPVTKGQMVANIVPTLASMPNRAELEAAVTQATAELELAHKDRERAERLLAARAVSSKRVDEARAAEATAEARFRAVQTNLAQMDALRGSPTNAPASAMFAIRSPIAGQIAEVVATPGSTVDAGQKLFRVVATDVVQIVAGVPEAEAHRIRDISGAELLRDEAQPLALGRPLSVARVIEPNTRTLSVVFQLPNKGGALAVGQSVQLRLLTSERSTAPAIPETAIVDDAGQPVVFVQLAGESFAQRAIKLGARESGYVQVEGLKPGDRVVSRGAYLIRLAALSGQVPTHGHVH